MTQLELWQKLQNCIKENGKFPSVKTFSIYSGIKEEILFKIFNRWAEEGKLIKKGTHYRVEGDEYKPSVKEIPQLIRQGDITILRKIVKGFALVLGLILTAVSIHFTFEFNKLSLPTVWAFLLSMSTVLFMNVAFVVRGMTENTIKRHLIILLWFLGIFYSVFTAVSGQFNDQRKYVASDTTVKTVNTKKILEKELKSLETKQSELIHWRELEKEYSLNPDLKTENPGTWKSIKSGIKELSEVETKISETNEKLISNINNMDNENRNVFSWIESVTGKSSDLIQFLIILFPALFIDLCSSVLIDFALGENKWKKQK